MMMEQVVNLANGTGVAQIVLDTLARSQTTLMYQTSSMLVCILGCQEPMAQPRPAQANACNPGTTCIPSLGLEIAKLKVSMMDQDGCHPSLLHLVIQHITQLR